MTTCILELTAYRTLSKIKTLLNSKRTRLGGIYYYPNRASPLIFAYLLRLLLKARNRSAVTQDL